MGGLVIAGVATPGGTGCWMTPPTSVILHLSDALHNSGQSTPPFRPRYECRADVLDDDGRERLDHGWHPPGHGGDLACVGPAGIGRPLVVDDPARVDAGLCPAPPRMLRPSHAPDEPPWRTPRGKSPRRSLTTAVPHPLEPPGLPATGGRDHRRD